MDAEILAIGTELLMGEIVDTNSAFIASRLPALGIRLRWVTQVGDDLEQMVEAFKRGLQRSELLISTGGLGPTQDDLTREAIATALGEQLVVDQGLLEEMREWFSRRGYPMPPSNIKQATLIPSATPLPNPRGTAPGWWVERDGHIIVAMPGIPYEMEHMWESQVAPRLRERARGVALVSRTVKTFGLSEAAVADRINDLFGRGVALGIYARSDGIHIRMTAEAPTPEEAREALRPLEEELRSRLGASIWGADGDTPEEQVGRALRRLGMSLATMESCTGGLLASTITDVPGASDYFRGGIVSYTNQVKVSFGVDPSLIERFGVVSAPVAEDMARVARQRLGADIGIGITGVAGPSELEGKPPGTVFIGLAWDGGSRSVQGRYPPERPLVKRRAVVHALLEVNRLLQEIRRPAP